MSNSSDLINLIVDILLPVGVTVHKFMNPAIADNTERIIVNCIPNSNVTRWGSNRMNRFIVNVNLYVLKMPDGKVNSGRLAILEASIMSALETYVTKSNRVKYYSIDPAPGTVINESDKETLMNIRINCTIT
jgi:hypothetical protein